MRTITVTDRTTTGMLAFDLRDLLALIRSQTAHMQWLVKSDLECTGERADELQEIASRRVRVSSHDLADLASGIRQVIDGEFRGYEPGRSSPTILLRAIDSSSWDIASDREDLLDTFRKHFRAVFEAGEPY